MSTFRSLGALLGAVMAASPLFVGCVGWDDDGWECWGCDCNNTCDWEEPEPPTLSVGLADWPPIGPETGVSVIATSTSGIESISAFYREEAFYQFAGDIEASLLVPGADIGEGFGSLTIQTEDMNGGWTSQRIDDVLVDLSPPHAFLETTLIPAKGGALTFWIGDAWIVSSYELRVGEALYSETLEPGYPETFGTAWDFSYVSIPSEALPVVSTEAELTVIDAAGNKAVFSVPLTVDGLPPEVQIASPEEGAFLEGAFQVELSAWDDIPEPVAIELYVGGTLVATAVSPATIVQLAASDFPEGPAIIEAIAIDAAGNQSAPVSRTVHFGPSSG